MGIITVLYLLANVAYVRILSGRYLARNFILIHCTGVVRRGTDRGVY